MKYAFWILLTIASLVTTACSKRAAKYNPHFMGTWRTDVIEDTATGTVYRNEIMIKNKKWGTFSMHCQDTCEQRLCNCESEGFGIAKVTNFEHRLIIGNSPHMQIDKEPYEVDGQWIMRIDRELYYKQ